MKIIFSNAFKKEYKLAKKRGKDLSKLEKILRLLEARELLPSKYRKHALRGDYQGAWELHIEPDWLLIYFESETSITLARMGSHADLFK